MFAIAEIKGHQYKVAQGDKLMVNRLNEAKAGDKMKFNEVLLVSDKEVTLGMPFISGAYVEVKVLGEHKDEKIRVFKMKAKKRYRRTQGHRQMYTEVEVVGISMTGGAKAMPKKTETAAVAAPTPAPAHEAPVKKTAPAVKAKAEKPAKKPVVKKTATAKKAPAKKAAKKTE